MRGWKGLALGVLMAGLLAPTVARAGGHVHRQGDGWVYVVDDKVAVPLPEPLPVGNFGARQGLFTRDMSTFFSFDLISSKVLNSKTPANDIAFLIRNTPDDVMMDPTLKVENTDRFATEMRYTANTCGGKLASLDRTRKFGDVLLHCVVQVLSEHPTADQEHMADQMSAAFVKGATLFSRDEDAPPKPKPVPPPAAPTPPTAGAANAKPEAGPKLSQKDQWAAAALAAAKRLQADGQDQDAQEKLQHLIDEYPDSPAAAEAKKLLAPASGTDAAAPPQASAPTTQPADSQSPAAAAKPAVVDPATRAAALLTMGDNYAAAGRDDLACQKYQAVITRYPDTPAAKLAKQKLAAAAGTP